MEEGKISRHCAFCLIPIAAKDVKNCGKCLRRAYCGKECQKKDWKSKKTSKVAAVEASKVDGQGHKDWCGLPVCEEDLDYFVKEGGKGVVAKRLILKGERILVGNTSQLEQRYASFAVAPTTRKVFNHACDANSFLTLGLDYEVSIITAEKDIKPGSEITYNYIGFGDYLVRFFIEGSFMPINSFSDARKALESLGIFCREDCFCYNKEMEQLIIKRRQVTKYLAQFEALKKTPSLVSVHYRVHDVISDFDVLQGPRMVKAQIICMLLHILRKPENRKHSHILIRNYEKEADDIFSSVYHPNTNSIFSKVGGWSINFHWACTSELNS